MNSSRPGNSAAPAALAGKIAFGRSEVRIGTAEARQTLPDGARAPNAAEIEWALLECSSQLSDGGDDEIRQDRDARMDALARLLAKDPDSLENRYHAALVEELRRQEDA